MIYVPTEMSEIITHSQVIREATKNLCSRVLKGAFLKRD